MSQLQPCINEKFHQHEPRNKELVAVICLRLIYVYFFPGEATFANDEPTQPHELHGVFIQSSVGSADIVSIDTSEALVS